MNTTNENKIQDLEKRIESLRSSLQNGDGFRGSPYEILEAMEDKLQRLRAERVFPSYTGPDDYDDWRKP